MQFLPCFCLQFDLDLGGSGAFLAPGLLYFAASVPCVLILVESNTFRCFPLLLQIDSCFAKRSAAKDRPQLWQGTRLTCSVDCSVGWLYEAEELCLVLYEGDGVCGLDIGFNLDGRFAEAAGGVDFLPLLGDDLLFMKVLSFSSGPMLWL